MEIMVFFVKDIVSCFTQQFSWSKNKPFHQRWPNTISYIFGCPEFFSGAFSWSVFASNGPELKIFIGGEAMSGFVWNYFFGPVIRSDTKIEKKLKNEIKSKMSKKT